MSDLMTHPETAIMAVERQQDWAMTLEQ